MIQGFWISTFWQSEHFRRIDGKLQQIGYWEDGNIVTNEGINHHLGVEFSGEDQITDWYICVFEDDYDPLITDTYAAPGYTECEALQELSRPIWLEGGAASKQISNVSNKASFTFSLGKTIYGYSLVGGGNDPSVIGDTAGGGVLFCASKFSGGSQAVIAGDVIKVTVTVTAASG